MTVVDTSAVVDLLLGIGVADEVGALFSREGELAAPDVLVFEVLAVLRRATLRGQLRDERAAGAVSDLGDLALALIPSLPLRLIGCGSFAGTSPPPTRSSSPLPRSSTSRW